MNSYFYLATLLALCIVPLVHLESVETPVEDAAKVETPVLETVEQPEAEAVINEVVEEVIEEEVQLLETAEEPTEDVVIVEEVEEEVVVVDEIVEEAVSCDATVEACDAEPVETIVEGKVDDVKIDVEKDPGMFEAILKFLHLI